MTEVYLKPGINYTYSYLLGVERDFNEPVTSEWMQRHWHVSLYISLLYLTLVFCGQAVMSKRSKWELRFALVAWNVFMGAFSTVGALRTIPELHFVLKTFGLRYSICNPSFVLMDKVSGFWCFAFALSKVLELLDTAFIILRKQKLIFLHWYHHASVLVLTWYFHASLTALGRWFICMNYFVHSIMYTYYALRALKVKIPRFAAMCVTAVQITQTVFGSYLILYAGIVWATEQDCQVSGDVVGLAFFLYSSNFALFAWLFYKSYLEPKRVKGKEA